MTDYLFAGKNDENVMLHTHKVNLVLCLECGTVIEKKNEDRAYCECSTYLYLDNRWVGVKAE